METLSVGLHDGEYWVYVAPSTVCDISDIPGSVLKRVPTVHDDAFWAVPVRYYAALLETLGAQGVRARPVPDKVLSVISRESVVVDEARLEGMTSFGKLTASQRASVRFVVSCGGRALNASEMGTGKTATGVCFAEYYADCRPQLIACPSSLRTNWQREFATFAGLDVQVIKSKSARVDGDRPCVASYDMLAAMDLPRFGLVVLDESHYIKNPDSKRAKALLRVCARAQRVLLLTGTPSSKPVDMFAQLKAIDPANFGAFFTFEGREPKAGAFFFANRYCAPKRVFIGRGRYAFQHSGSALKWELHALVSKYMTRYTKAEALAHLPPKYRERVVYDTLDNAVKEGFKARLDEVAELRESDGVNKANALLSELVRDTAGHKLDLVTEYVRQLVDSSQQKCLLFAHHKSVMAAIRAALDEREKPYVTIDGSTPTAKRQELVDRFQDTDLQFAVLSIRASGTGLNFYNASLVVFCELLWSEKDHLQAEDRAHRNKQQNPVTVRYLMLDGTTDDVLWRTLQHRARTASLLVDNRAGHMGAQVCAAEARDGPQCACDGDCACAFFRSIE
jgi:SWI/SNF-related matrix-associated actin-dependent regulator 1 of chromatin subfamily A